MGGSKKYNPNGGFTEQTYKTVGITANGIKILEKIKGGSSSLPIHSNTPNTMYAVRDSKTKELKQVSAYGGKNGRNKIKDIDWSHEHAPYIDIHVHEYNKDGQKIKVRKPSKKERRIAMRVRNGR